MELPDISPILGIDFAHLTVTNIILIVIVLAGILSHVVPNGSKLQQVLNVIGTLTFKANQPANTDEKKVTSGIVSKVTKTTMYIGLSIVSFILVMVALVSCKPAVAIADMAYDLCVASMKVEPLVVQAAQARQLDVLKYTKDICKVVEVVHPYVEYLKAERQDAGPNQLPAPPTPRALQAAQSRDLI
jgi:hypothetical protein